ncbi:hypothetical protein ACFFX0_25535 [Citricoccus parietis]|uniref:Uncharacterized protein n=1 Tax=Citricoccus parietis TaxID=592307 RepID=A0ABV5G604_9MICC
MRERLLQGTPKSLGRTLLGPACLAGVELHPLTADRLKDANERHMRQGRARVLDRTCVVQGRAQRPIGIVLSYADIRLVADGHGRQQGRRSPVLCDLTVQELDFSCWNWLRILPHLRRLQDFPVFACRNSQSCAQAHHLFIGIDSSRTPVMRIGRSSDDHRMEQLNLPSLEHPTGHRPLEPRIRTAIGHKV